MVSRVTRQVALVGMLLVLTDCTRSIANLKCRDVEAEVVNMEKGNLLKITGAYVVSRSPTELVCKGTGIYPDNSEAPIRYRAYIDEDREIMVAYDSDEAEAAEEAKEQRETDAEIERTTSAFNKMVDDAYSGIE